MGVDFYNRQAINFSLTENTIDTVLYQGTIFRQLITSTGEQYQRYQIGTPDHSVSDYYNDVAATGDIFAIIGGVVPANGNIAQVTGGTRFEKTLRGLWHHNATSAVFFENTRVDGRVEIQFGNGIYGISPAAGDNIIMVWVETLGTDGNNGVTGLTVSYPVTDGITGVTLGPISAGEDQPGPDFYKRFGSDIYSARDRGVSRPDYRALIQTYPGVRDVLVEGQQDILEQQTVYAAGIGTDKTTAWVTDRSQALVQAYSLITGASDDTRANLQLNSLNTDPRGIWINPEASATATIDVMGVVDSLTITDGGTGYTGDPIVELSLPDDTTGTRATATVTINSSGVVDTITINEAGSGYLTAPTVRISTEAYIVDAGSPPRVFAYNTLTGLEIVSRRSTLNTNNNQPRDLHWRWNHRFSG